MAKCPGASNRGEVTTFLKPKRKRKLPRLVDIREGLLTSDVFLGRGTLTTGISWPGRKRPGRINIPNSLCSHWLKQTKSQRVRKLASITRGISGHEAGGEVGRMD